MAIDLGTGDGRAVLQRAAAEPRTLVIGIDADAAAMAETSRRAARHPRKGGLPNAIFVAAAAEMPPFELAGRAELLTITLPWGSLLRGVLGRDDAVTAGIASLMAPSGSVRTLVSWAARDGIGAPDPDAIAVAWARHGIRLAGLREASMAELGATPSTWARRLGLGAEGRGAGRGAGRQAWLLELDRGSPAPGSIGR